jgi:hypothetical protein
LDFENAKNKENLDSKKRGKMSRENKQTFSKNLPVKMFGNNYQKRKFSEKNIAKKTRKKRPKNFIKNAPKEKSHKNTFKTAASKIAHAKNFKENNFSKKIQKLFP